MTAAAAPLDALRRGQLKIHVLKRAAEFTMVPAAAAKALEIGRNPACSVNEYAGAIERDVRLTADILGMANSSLYAAGAPATSLREAIMRLGLRRCQSLILSTCTAGLMRQLPIQQSQVRQRLWRHGYITALICRHMNDELTLHFQGEEFTAGLLHDLGWSLLAATVPEALEGLEETHDRTADGLLERERAQLNTDHCELGAAFAARAGLPASLIAAIGHHHAPHKSGEHQRLVALVAVADHLAQQIEAYQEREFHDQTPHPHVHLLAEHQDVRRALAGLSAEITLQAASEACRLIA